jgi:hypothetical protein
MKKVLWGLLAVILVVSAGIYFYLYKGHRDIQTEKPKFELTAEKLVADFQENQTLANQNYLNQTLQIQGVVKEMSDSAMTLSPGVFCTFSEVLEHQLVKKAVTVKCRCIGYDELFGEVKLDQCSILK